MLLQQILKIQLIQFKLSYFAVVSTAQFSFKDAADVGDITAISLKRDEAGWFPKWQLARVSKADSFLLAIFSILLKVYIQSVNSSLLYYLIVF